MQCGIRHYAAIYESVVYIYYLSTIHMLISVVVIGVLFFVGVAGYSSISSTVRGTETKPNMSGSSLCDFFFFSCLTIITVRTIDSR